MGLPRRIQSETPIAQASLARFVFRMHFIRITKLCLTFVLNGTTTGRNGVARVVSCLHLCVKQMCRGRLVQRRGEYYRLQITFAGGKNAASQQALVCLFSGDCRFWSRAYVRLEPERLRHHRRNRYGYKRSCCCERDRNLDESG